MTIGGEVDHPEQREFSRVAVESYFIWLCSHRRPHSPHHDPSRSLYACKGASALFNVSGDGIIFAPLRTKAVCLCCTIRQQRFLRRVSKWRGREEPSPCPSRYRTNISSRYWSAP